MTCRRPGPVRRAWASLRRRLARLIGREPPQVVPPDWGDEPALVPVGPPRRPLPAAAVALEPSSEIDPLVYPVEIEALGRPLSGRSAGHPSSRWHRLLAVLPFRRSSPAL